MALSLTSTQPGANADYIPYLWSDPNGPPKKTDRYNDSVLLDFALVPWDGNFVRLARGAYITFNTATYGVWFSGYITNEPQLEWVGVDHNKNPVWGYLYEATSDEYLLSLQPIGIIPAYINTTQGAILADLANQLAPGVFDTTHIGAGQYVAQFQPLANQRFSDIVKQFCDSASYIFNARAHKLYFYQQDSKPAGIKIDGNDPNFTPSQLTIQPSQLPVINDCTVLGQLEPQAYMNEYFVGSGFDAQFPLVAPVFGVDRYILLADDFSSSGIDGTNWEVFDTSGAFLQVSGGYLNCLGGHNNGSYDIYMVSQNPMPLEGSLKLTHGEWDFLDASATNKVHGVICGLWTQAPNSSFTGCVYGLAVRHDSSGNYMVNPIVNGVMDTTVEGDIDPTKRYVIRTVASFERINRQSQKFTYTDATGTVQVVESGPLPDEASYQTYFTEIDPTNGLVTGTTVMPEANISLSNSVCYADYIPVASDNLNVTFSGTTISIPLQATLSHKNTTDPAYVQDIIGPNEIDSLDNTTPVATIVAGNSNSSSTSTFTGKPQYNPGQATLTYFKDSVQLVSALPPVGSLINLQYRAAGTALGRSQSIASIINENALWGDSGVRSLVQSNLPVSPRNSLECELAAASIVGDNNYQHFEGTYNQYSMYCTAEPTSGTMLKFVNLPSGFIAATCEEITEVDTIFDNASPSEVFIHTITFGKGDYLRKAVAKFNNPIGSFQPSATTVNADAIDYNSVGLSYAPDVTSVALTSFDHTNLNFTINQSAPSGGGFEIRYTDDSWGADDGKNLIARTSSSTFSIPRNIRGKAAFVRAYDVRNLMLYSEDMTQSAWYSSSATVTLVPGIDENNAKATLNSVAFGAGGYIGQSLGLSSGNHAFSISVKGTAGSTIKIQTTNPVTTSTTYTLTGSWQKLFVVGSSTQVQVLSTTAQTVLITRAQAEAGTNVTMYSKTNAAKYGNVSRYSAGVRVSFPLVPPAPVGVIDDTTSPTAPTLTIDLPELLQDVWGVEIRARDNATVLYHQDLINSGYGIVYTDPSPVQPLTYFIYTYNVLGEYSVPGAFEISTVVPTNESWMPYFDAPVVHDALHPTTDLNYDLYQSYATAADGTQLSTLVVTGNLPVNRFIPNTSAATVGSVILGTSGGASIPGGITAYVCVAGMNSAGQFSPPSNVIEVQVPTGSSTNTLELANINWPLDNVSVVTQYVVFASTDPRTLCAQPIGSSSLLINPLTTVTSLGVTVITTSTATLKANFYLGTFGVPNPSFDKLRIKGKVELHGGVAGGAVSQDATSFTIKCHNLIDIVGISGVFDNWAGRTLSMIYRQSDGVSQELNFKVFSFDHTTGTFVIDSSSIDPSGLVHKDDVFIIRAQATAFSSNTIIDSGFINIESSHLGLVAATEQGCIVRIIHGTGKGQFRNVYSNSSTGYTVDPPWDIVPDATSMFIVEPRAWTYVAESSSGTKNLTSNIPVTVSIPVDNYVNCTFLTMAFTVAVDGTESDEEVSPFKEIWFTGSAGAIGEVVVADPTSLTASYVYDNNGYAIVTAGFTPPSDPNFQGVHAYLEIPDFSAPGMTGMQLDSGTLDNSSSVPGQRLDLGVFESYTLDSSGNASIVLPKQPPPPTTQNWRVYLGPIGSSYDPVVTPANQPSPTPSVTVSLTPQVSITGGLGEEYAPLVSNFAQFGSISTQFFQGSYQYQVTFTWNDPTAAQYPDRYQSFAGVVLYAFPQVSGGSANATSYTVAAGVGYFTTPWIDIPVVAQTWTFAALSYNQNGQQNTLSFLITPQVVYTTPTFDLTNPGTLLADVTGFSCTSGYGYDHSGNYDLIITPLFIPPSDPAWNEVALVCNAPSGSGFFNVLNYASVGDGSYDDLSLIPPQFAPSVTQNWDVYAVSVDVNGNPKYPITGITSPSQLGTSPKSTVSVSPQASALGTGTEYAPLVTGVMGLGIGGDCIVYNISTDGVEQFGFSASWVNPTGDSRFQGVVPTVVYTGGTPIPLGSLGKDDTTTTSPLWPFTTGTTGIMYFLSQDGGGRTNSIQTGITPGISFNITVQTTGSLSMARVKASTLASSLAVTSGTLGVAQIDLSKTIASTLAANLTIVGGKLAITGVDLSLALGSSYNGAEFMISGGALTVNGVDLSKAISTSLTPELAVTSGKFGVASLSAGKITAGTLVSGVVYAGSITASQIVSGTIASSIIYAGSINTGQINAGTLGAGIVYAGSITAAQVTSGSFTGVSLTLSANGVTTSVTNSTDPSSGHGIRVTNNANSNFSMMIEGGFRTYTSTGGAIIDLSSSGTGSYVGTLSIRDSIGSLVVLQPTKLAFQGTKVIGVQQTGPGAATGTLVDVVSKFNSLYAALQTHGLVT